MRTLNGYVYKKFNNQAKIINEINKILRCTLRLKPSINKIKIAKGVSLISDYQRQLNNLNTKKDEKTNVVLD
tara:strand:- start:6729 stop:6944 length:216 start_codon:yes stop_codon:yes gene_type:complete